MERSSAKGIQEPGRGLEAYTSLLISSRPGSAGSGAGDICCCQQPVQGFARAYRPWPDAPYSILQLRTPRYTQRSSSGRSRDSIYMSTGLTMSTTCDECITCWMTDMRRQGLMQNMWQESVTVAQRYNFSEMMAHCSSGVRARAVLHVL